MEGAGEKREEEEDVEGENNTGAGGDPACGARAEPDGRLDGI